MDIKKIEKKWQAIWEKEKLGNFNSKNTDKKYYCLEMFSYPSAAKLHLLPQRPQPLQRGLGARHDKV